jgi:copper/silver efflux system protein
MKNKSILNRSIYLAMKNQLVVFLGIGVLLLWGLIVSPFDSNNGFIPRNPVSVDAIPNIGENQQIVFTKWMGASPTDVEDQITYPLSQILMGIPGVKTVRASSMFGFSSIYVIFKENVDFYWSRTRLLEKMNSLPPNYLPKGVSPMLGPPATALGQVFWYTLEGRDEDGNPAGGWDLHELRTVQDYFIRYRLSSVDGVAEVASIGGFVKEFHIEINPESLRKFKFSLFDVAKAVKSANRDVGARTIEINSIEYMIKGVGRAKNIKDLKSIVVKSYKGVPVTLDQVANIVAGPALRRGILDKEGSEAVGGVVTVTQGANTLLVINRIKDRIKEIKKGMPTKTLNDGRISRLTVVPFYDRTKLINDTLDTLKTALRDEILVTIIVVLVMLGHFKSSLLISSILPFAILFTFIVMKNLNMEANILALSGIAIAIGTMVDMGIVITENIVRHLNKKRKGESLFETVYKATTEVASAVLTSVATTVVSFIPVFAMTATEGKLFKPLAYTKTFALMGSLMLAIFLIPVLALTLFGKNGKLSRRVMGFVWGILAVYITVSLNFLLGLLMVLTAVYPFVKQGLSLKYDTSIRLIFNILLALIIVWILSGTWMPLGEVRGVWDNFVITFTLMSMVLGAFLLFQHGYTSILRWCIEHKMQFLVMVSLILCGGFIAWSGFKTISKILPETLVHSQLGQKLKSNFPGLQKEFMPELDEGTFLFMPTVMPHASIGEARKIMRLQDMSIGAIPEVSLVVGKLGRADTTLDPAPISMFETIISYKTKYLRSKSKELLRFRHVSYENDYFRDVKGEKVKAPDNKPYIVEGKYLRDKSNNLIPDPDGIPFPLWRSPLKPLLNGGRSYWKGIDSPHAIWDQIVVRAKIPGSTSAPKLQPISTRLVMLQSGIRAAMAIKVLGATSQEVQNIGINLEEIIKEVPSVNPVTVSAERAVAKPYLEITPKDKLSLRYGLNRGDLMSIIEMAVGGLKVMTIIDKRERVPVRIRYLRGFRQTLLSLKNLTIPVKGGNYIPLSAVANIRYVKGPQVIKSENSFKTSAVTFDAKKGFSRVTVMEEVVAAIDSAVLSKRLKIPHGITLKPAGTYEHHQRATKTLKIIIPLALIIIFTIIYMQFKSVVSTMIIFSGIAVSWAGGFIMIWLYGQPWFMDFVLFGANIRELFHIAPMNMSVGVWVGFLALFGIATDDGVVMVTYLTQRFSKPMNSIEEVRTTTVKAGKMRVRACLMTTATTILALMPVLTSTGRGSDIMGPMAVPIFGGMVLEVFTMLVVPVLYSLFQEIKFGFSKNSVHPKVKIVPASISSK